ncbi:MAG: PCRF domain-containing protein, partial [Oscillospiraceae bacterium]|nr:PCRF domain-containing protein [Oscillospiraceae bacterium]
MILLDELKVEMNGYRKEVEELGEVLDIKNAQQEVKQLQEQAAQEGFWDDLENSQKVLQKTKQLENRITDYQKIQQRLDDILTMIEMCMEEPDEDMQNEIVAEIAGFKQELEAKNLETLLSGEYDSKNAILTFHAGAGGTEAQDWAEMLYRMYNRWAERHNFKVELLDYLDGEEAGLKSACMMVSGENAYGYLKSEAGVHRLVRVSPFDAS